MRVGIGVVGVVGVWGGAGDFKPPELGALRSGEGEVASLFKGRLRVLFDTLLFNCGAEAFFAIFAGVCCKLFKEGFLGTGVDGDDN